MKSTVGKILLNEAFPEEYRDYEAEWTGDFLNKKLLDLAKKDPENYTKTLDKLIQLSKTVGTLYQRISPGIEDLIVNDKEILNLKQESHRKINEILKQEKNTESRNEKIVNLLVDLNKKIKSRLYEKIIETDSPFAIMAKSGTKGNKDQLSRILVGDVIYTDHADRPIPFPILRSYAESLMPAEFWAATYGARKGLVGTKLWTGKVGYLTKQLAFSTHRLIVTHPPYKLPPDFNEQYNVRAIPVNIDDPDIEGSVLAREFGNYKRGTILTSRIIEDLKNKNIKRILIRSPIVSNTPSGGIYAVDVGLIENGQFPEVGSIVGLRAAQAISEPITQLQISSKHKGGVVEKSEENLGGFKFLNTVLQVPQQFPNSVIYTEVDGKVTKVSESPLGGYDVYISSDKGTQVYYVPPDRKVIVEEGSEVEAGDELSTGTPNMTFVVKHKGIGDGRLHLLNVLYDFYKREGIPIVRKNLEVVVRGIVNHVKINKRYKYFLPGDILYYSDLERFYEPRPGSKEEKIEKALGKYLEKPVLHYTIGTRITPRIIKTLKEFDINTILVHNEPPPFSPIMIPLERQILFDPDWQTKLLGGYQLRKFLSQFYEGASTDFKSTSYVPALASGIIGKEWPDNLLKDRQNE